MADKVRGGGNLDPASLEDSMRKMFFSSLAVLVIVAGMALSGCGGGGSSSSSSGSAPSPSSPSGTVEGNAK